MFSKTKAKVLFITDIQEDYYPKTVPSKITSSSTYSMGEEEA